MSTPASDRRAYPRTHGPACTADQCQQGRTACPCPQACEPPGADADPLHDEPATAFELVGMWLVIAAIACWVILAIHLWPSA